MEGLRIWMLQRVSAVYLAAYLVFVLVFLLLHPVPDFTTWRQWFSSPLMAIASAGFILALLIHGWVGLRDVVLDYVHHLGARLVLLTMIAFLLIACGFWAVRILILVSGNP